MPSRLAVRQGVPYTREREALMRAARRIYVDRNRDVRWVSQLVAALTAAVAKLDEDQVRHGVEPTSASLDVQRGTKPRPQPLDTAYGREHVAVERLIRKIGQDETRTHAWRANLLISLHTALQLFEDDARRMRSAKTKQLMQA